MHADQVDPSSVLARRSATGYLFRLAGYLLICLALVLMEAPAWQLWTCAGTVLLVWLLAWYLAVGALWRTALVAALLVCAVLLSLRQVELF
ncbi:MAG: hypothetical protein ACOCXJ_06845 [Planctomycetota bacterium]